MQSHCFLAFFFFPLVLLKEYIFQYHILEFPLCLWLHRFTVVLLGEIYFLLDTLGLCNIFSLMLCSLWKFLIHYFCIFKNITSPFFSSSKIPILCIFGLFSIAICFSYFFQSTKLLILFSCANLLLSYLLNL